MDLKSGSPFSLFRHALGGAYPPLVQDTTCEVCVVGGGISGALSAFHLVEAGLDTVLVDKRDIGFGSTAASTGLLQNELDLPLHLLIGMLGEDAAVAVYRLCRKANKQIAQLAERLGNPCDFQPRRSLYLARKAQDVKSLENEFICRKKYGFPVELLTGQELTRRFSLARPGALLSAEAAQVDAFSLTHALLRAASKRGLRAFDRTTMTKQEERGKALILTTDRGSHIRCRALVLATGYEAKPFLKPSRVKLVSTFAIASEPLSRSDTKQLDYLLWETARPYLYLCPTADGRVLVGGEDEPFVSARMRSLLLPQKSRTLQKKFRALFPQIDFEVACSWAGTFGETIDTLPLIGACPQRPRTYFALGYGANGITFSQIAAGIVTDLILGKQNAASRLFGFDRPRTGRVN